VLFGAPVWQEDDGERAVACAVAMQLAMAQINEQNRAEDLPEIEMGIGVHSGQVVVGNIGSPERMKYGVVGSNVNLTSRIQSFTTGGQVLISEATRQEVGSILKLGKQMEVKAKGVEHPVTIYEILGIGGQHKLLLTDSVETLVKLAEEIPFRYEVVEASQIDGTTHEGCLTKLAAKSAEAQLAAPVPELSNLKMQTDRDGKDVLGAIYAKIVGTVDGSDRDVTLRFTSVAPEGEKFLRGLLEPRPAEAAPPKTAARKRSAASL
jgi:adenylate cyclase